jgi:membrane-associated protease RseP (regulator of RpoE activity)
VGSPRQGQSEQELHQHTTGHSSVDSDPALIAAAPPHDYELQRGEEGFGMDIGPTATVVFFSGPNSAAKRAGVPIGGRITKVDGVAVGTKDEVLAQLAAAGATVVFTVAARNPAEPPRTPLVRQLSDASRHAVVVELGEAGAEARAVALAAELAAIGDEIVAKHDS